MTRPRTETTPLIRVHPRAHHKLQRSDWRGYPTDGQGPWMRGAGEASEPNPHINILSPNTVSAAAGAITVTVDGFGFRPSSVVEIDQVAQTTTYVNGTRLTISYNPTVAGTVQFTVRDGDGESNSVPFIVAALGEDDPVTNPAGWVIADFKEWVDANPEWADEALTAERARGDQARQSLLDWLEGFIEHRDE